VVVGTFESPRNYLASPLSMKRLAINTTSFQPPNTPSKDNDYVVRAPFPGYEVLLDEAD